MKWKSKITAVDRNTGEILKQNDIKSGNYIILDKIITYTKEDTLNGTRHIKWICENSRQYKLEFGTTN